MKNIDGSNDVCRDVLIGWIVRLVMVPIASYRGMSRWLTAEMCLSVASSSIPLERAKSQREANDINVCVSFFLFCVFLSSSLSLFLSFFLPCIALFVHVFLPRTSSSSSCWPFLLRPQGRLGLCDNPMSCEKDQGK